MKQPHRTGRFALALAVTFLAAGSGFARLGAQAVASVPDVKWEMHELAPGVFASIVAPPANPASYASSLVVVQDDHVVVVDTRESPEAGRALLEDIRRVTDKPVTVVINTHWHGDHLYGNQAFVDAFPEVRIIGHPATTAKLESDGEARLAGEIERRHQRVTRWQRWLDAGRTDSGHTLTAAERIEVEQSMARAEQEAHALEAVRITPPTDTISTQLVMKSGGREIRVIHPGPAHTDGDLVVYLPAERLLVMGDLIEQGFPYFGDGSVVGSAWALDRLSLLEVERVLPSHGRLQERTDLLSTQRIFLRAVVDAARRETAAPGSSFQTFRTPFTRGNPALDERFDTFAADLHEKAGQESDTLRTRVAACGAPEFRAFDFWIGSWEVTGPQGNIVGHNRIESAHGGCVLRENWTGATGSVGQSLNSYDRSRAAWHQTWVDNGGLLLLLDGNPVDGGMRLAGETQGPDGSVTKHRITWTVEADDGSLVRQLWESSTDGGESWAVAFNGLYKKIGH